MPAPSFDLGFYRLDENHNLVRCRDVYEWARMFEAGNRHVGDEEIGPLRVSTVFLGLDHNYSQKGPPLVFETMIFGPPEDTAMFGRLAETRPALEMWRYATWAEAETGHKVACEIARQHLAETDATLHVPRETVTRHE